MKSGGRNGRRGAIIPFSPASMTPSGAESAP